MFVRFVPAHIEAPAVLPPVFLRRPDGVIGPWHANGASGTSSISIVDRFRVASALSVNRPSTVT